MPLFRCEDCGCVDNTALTNYWFRTVSADFRRQLKTPKPARCSACDPDIGAWHGEFPQRSADGMFVDDEGFLYYEAELTQLARGRRIVGRIVNGAVEAVA